MAQTGRQVKEARTRHALICVDDKRRQQWPSSPVLVQVELIEHLPKAAAMGLVSHGQPDPSPRSGVRDSLLALRDLNEPVADGTCSLVHRRSFPATYVRRSSSTWRNTPTPERLRGVVPASSASLRSWRWNSTGSRTIRAGSLWGRRLRLALQLRRNCHTSELHSFLPLQHRPRIHPTAPRPRQRGLPSHGTGPDYRP